MSENEVRIPVGAVVLVRPEVDNGWRMWAGWVGMLEGDDGADEMPYKVRFGEGMNIQRDLEYRPTHGYFDLDHLIMVTKVSLPSTTIAAAEERQHGAFDWSDLQQALAEIDGSPLAIGAQLRNVGESIREALNHFGIPTLAPIEALQIDDFVLVIGGEHEGRLNEIGRVVADDKSSLPYRVGFHAYEADDGYTDYDWFRRDDLQKVSAQVEPVHRYQIVED